MIEKSEPGLVQAQEAALPGEAGWLAQMLARGGDPGPQLKRAGGMLSSLGGLGRRVPSSSQPWACSTGNRWRS
jgi:hypothetical protein